MESILFVQLASDSHSREFAELEDLQIEEADLKATEEAQEGLIATETQVLEDWRGNTEKENQPDQLVENDFAYLTCHSTSQIKRSTSCLANSALSRSVKSNTTSLAGPTYASLTVRELRP